MSIQNTGSCPLIFRLSLMDVLEGDIPRPRDKSPQRSTIKRRKGKAESGKSAKAEFDDNLLPNEELAIFGGNLKRSEDRSGFSFWNVDENMQLLVPERKTVEFGVRFQAISEGKDSDAKESTKATPRVKKKANAKKNVDKQKETNYCHVAIVKLTLGSCILLDFIIVCSMS
ncbi:uncharacterized protein LOC100741409 [Bombus impatiens]|nr:uncharacterized protein LOC100741409 [Bombus impatiens]